MQFWKRICITVVVLQYVGALSRADLLVDSKAGLIRGQAAADGDYSMFLGIPYAKVDQANPFGLSVPHPKFEDTFEAFHDSEICPQISEFDSTQIVGTPDCLQLNVFVPANASSSSRLPVLVWIHGGGYTFGFSGRSVYGPRFLVRHDVILVTVNYRLGPYGFMCLDTPAVPGNQGLRDQRIALNWVKENIEAFGGDENKITIFGESAGAGSVDYHIHLDQDNLFSQAILQSGTILAPREFKKASNDELFQLGAHLGFETNDVNDALIYLASIDPKHIVASSRDLGFSFRPCIENNFDDIEPVLTDHPINLPAKNTTVPLLVGFTSHECILTYEGFDADYFAENVFLRDTLKNGFELESDTFAEMSELLKNFYFGDKPIGHETRSEVIDLCSDFSFVHPTLRTLRKFFNSGTENIFLYMFSYVGKRNYIMNLNNITYNGASHADELSYLFDVFFVEDIMPDEDQIIVDRITTLWTNFAKHGDPTPESSELLPVKWTPATRDQSYYLNIDSELTLETRPYHERMAFLDLFYKTFGEYQIGLKKNDNYKY